jgi:hypothetical protein
LLPKHVGRALLRAKACLSYAPPFLELNYKNARSTSMFRIIGRKVEMAEGERRKNGGRRGKRKGEE